MTFFLLFQPFKPFLLDPTKDPTSSFYKSPLKLPPEPLWEALQYNGDWYVCSLTTFNTWNIRFSPIYIYNKFLEEVVERE